MAGCRRTLRRARKIPGQCGGRRVKRRVLTAEEIVKLSARWTNLLLPWSPCCSRPVCGLRGWRCASVKTWAGKHTLHVPELLIKRRRVCRPGGFSFQASNGVPLNPANVMDRRLKPAAKEVRNHQVEKSRPHAPQAHHTDPGSGGRGRIARLVLHAGTRSRGTRDGSLRWVSAADMRPALGEMLNVITSASWFTRK